jgi:hypothetical protein
MRSKQELRRILDQYDIDHAKQGGFKGAARKLIKEGGARGTAMSEVVGRLFPDLPAEDRATLGDMLDRGEDREAEIDERFLICQHCKRPSPAKVPWCADCCSKYPHVAAMKRLIDEGTVCDSGRSRDGLIVWVHKDAPRSN